MNKFAEANGEVIEMPEEKWKIFPACSAIHSYSADYITRREKENRDKN